MKILKLTVSICNFSMVLMAGYTFLSVLFGWPPLIKNEAAIQLTYAMVTMGYADMWKVRRDD